jgi:hypothetical protein
MSATPRPMKVVSTSHDMKIELTAANAAALAKYAELTGQICIREHEPIYNLVFVKYVYRPE